MSLLNEFFKVSISIKPIKVVSHQIVAENILMLQKIEDNEFLITRISLTYHIRHKPRPLYASRLDGLEEIDHSLSFQSLQLSMDADECTSTTNTITEVGECMHDMHFDNMTTLIIMHGSIYLSMNVQ